MHEGAILVEPPPDEIAGAAVFLLDGSDAAIPGNFFGACRPDISRTGSRNRAMTKQEQQNLVLTIWNICI